MSETAGKTSDQQQFYADRFYMQHGPCCAGCDHWEGFGGNVGECKNSKLMSGFERAAMIDMHPIGWIPPAGHALTFKDYKCSDFKDDFDWDALSEFYKRRIGYNPRHFAITHRPKD